MLFQLGATDEMPAAGSDERQTLTHATRFPGFSVLAPDLRSERRPTRVMGPAGWDAFERALAKSGRGDHILVMSSVPLLGPRLSWVERLLDVFPGAQEYEDDLRDQWQSRSHRAEWRRMLETLERQSAEGQNPITILSGEIHLATRGEMQFRNGTIMHQLVASGIAHPPPSAAYALGLGLLASLGENPVPDRQVGLKPLPGRRRIYAGERNYLVLGRHGQEWSAAWQLEESGRTPLLRLSTGA